MDWLYFLPFWVCCHMLLSSPAIPSEFCHADRLTGTNIAVTEQADGDVTFVEKCRKPGQRPMWRPKAPSRFVLAVLGPCSGGSCFLNTRTRAASQPQPSTPFRMQFPESLEMFPCALASSIGLTQNSCCSRGVAYDLALLHRRIATVPVSESAYKHGAFNRLQLADTHRWHCPTPHLAMTAPPGCGLPASPCGCHRSQRALSPRSSSRCGALGHWRMALLGGSV